MVNNNRLALDHQLRMEVPHFHHLEEAEVA
jgi:hypothetical protein